MSTPAYLHWLRRELWAHGALCSVLASLTVQAAPADSNAPPATACVAAHYKLIALPLVPASINAARHVAGTTGEHRAALWTEETGLTVLPLPAGFIYSEGIAINATGHVLVMAYDRTFSRHQAYVFARGALKPLPGEQPRGFRINDADEIAGEALAPGTQTAEPVFWSKNKLQRMGACCGGTAKDINKSGVAVGDVYDEGGRYSAFIWSQARGMQRIGPADRYSSAISINDQGHAVIQAFTAVFLYDSESLTKLALAKKFPSHPHAMNNCDVIVGAYGPFSDKDRAFLWEKSIGFQDLNSRIPPDSGWKLESAAGINDRGDIVGRGDHLREDDRGFLLVPEP